MANLNTPEDLEFDPVRLQDFLKFMRQQAQNPDPLTDYFHIPENLPPAWQSFFDAVLKYGEEACAAEPHERMAWEKRGMMMEDEHMNEFEMIVSAAKFKEKGNEEFRTGEFSKASAYYMTSIRAFPMPDAMLNFAQVMLKTNRFPVAETYCTKAFDMDLISNPATTSKAFFRRAKARRHQGKFSDALEDIRAAASLMPHDATIQWDVTETECLVASTEDEKAAYIARQPQALPNMTWDTSLGLITDCDLNYLRIPPFVDMTLVKPPTF